MSSSITFSSADQVRIWMALGELHRAGDSFESVDLERYVALPAADEGLVDRIREALRLNPAHQIPDRLGAPGLGPIASARLASDLFEIRRPELFQRFHNHLLSQGLLPYEADRAHALNVRYPAGSYQNYRAFDAGGWRYVICPFGSGLVVYRSATGQSMQVALARPGDEKQDQIFKHGSEKKALELIRSTFKFLPVTPLRNTAHSILRHIDFGILLVLIHDDEVLVLGDMDAGTFGSQFFDYKTDDTEAIPPWEYEDPTRIRMVSPLQLKLQMEGEQLLLAQKIPALDTQKLAEALLARKGSCTQTEGDITWHGKQGHFVILRLEATHPDKVIFIVVMAVEEDAPDLLAGFFRHEHESRMHDLFEGKLDPKAVKDFLDLISFTRVFKPDPPIVYPVLTLSGEAGTLSFLVARSPEHSHASLFFRLYGIEQHEGRATLADPLHSVRFTKPKVKAPVVGNLVITPALIKKAASDLARVRESLPGIKPLQMDKLVAWFALQPDGSLFLSTREGSQAVRYLVSFLKLKAQDKNPTAFVVYRLCDNQLSVAISRLNDPALLNLRRTRSDEDMFKLVLGRTFMPVTAIAELGGHAFAFSPTNTYYIGQLPDGQPHIIPVVSSPKDAFADLRMKPGQTRPVLQPAATLRPVDYRAVNEFGVANIFTPEGFDAIPRTHPSVFFVHGQKCVFLPTEQGLLGFALLIRQGGLVMLVPGLPDPLLLKKIHLILESPSKVTTDPEIEAALQGRNAFQLSVDGNPLVIEGLPWARWTITLPGRQVHIQVQGKDGQSDYVRTDVFCFQETLPKAPVLFQNFQRKKNNDPSVILIGLKKNWMKFHFFKASHADRGSAYLLSFDIPGCILMAILDYEEGVPVWDKLKALKGPSGEIRIPPGHALLGGGFNIQYFHQNLAYPEVFGKVGDGKSQYSYFRTAGSDLHVVMGLALEEDDGKMIFTPLSQPLKEMSVQPPDPSRSNFAVKRFRDEIRPGSPDVISYLVDGAQQGPYLVLYGPHHHVLIGYDKTSGELQASLLEHRRGDDPINPDGEAPLFTVTLTKGGLPLEDLIPIPNSSKHLRIREDELDLLEQDEATGRLVSEPLLPKRIKFPPVIIDHFAPLEELASGINTLKTSISPLTVRIPAELKPGKNLLTIAQGPLPVAVRLCPDGLPSQITLRDMVRGVYRGSATIEIRWGQAGTPVRYSIAAQGRELILTPNDKPAGQIRLVPGHDQLIIETNSELFKSLDAGLYGPALKITVDRNEPRKVVLEVSGDEKQTLLKALQEALDPENKTALSRVEVDPDGSWALAYGFKFENINYLTGLLMRVKAVYAQHLQPRSYSWTPPLAEKKEEVPVVALPAPLQIPRHEALQVQTPVHEAQTVIAGVDHTMGEEGEHYLVSTLSVTAGRLLEITSSDNPVVWPILLEDGKKPVLELLVETKTGWEKIRMSLELGAGPVIEVTGHEALSRTALTRETVIPVDVFTLKLFSLTNPHTGALELTGAEAVLGGVTIRIPGKYPRVLNLPTVFKVPDPFAGEIEFKVSRTVDGAWKARRSPAEFDWQLDATGEIPVLRAISLGDQNYEIPLAVAKAFTARGKSVRYFIPESKIAELNVWLSRMGHTPVAGAQEVTPGPQISLTPVIRNSDGSWPVRELVLSNFEARTLDDFLAGQADNNILFGAQDWPLMPRAVLLPSRSHLDHLVSLYKANPGRRDPNFMPHAPGSVLAELLDYETGSGFGLGLPVTWAARRFPFRLDAEGRFIRGAHEELLFDDDGNIWLDGGRRPLTYFRGQENNRRMADTSLNASDESGNWRISIVTQAGLHLLFAVVRHPLSPVLTALVDISDVNNDPAARDKREREAQKALEDHLLAYFAKALDPVPVENLFQVTATPTARGMDLDYSGTTKGVQLELSGVYFADGKLHFESCLTLKRLLNSQTQVLTLEHQMTDEPDVICLKERLAGGGLGRVYEWNLRLKTLLQLNREIPAIHSSLKVQEQIIGSNLPLTLSAAKAIASSMRPSSQAARWQPVSVTSSVWLPSLPDNDRSFVMPPQSHIQKLVDPRSIQDFLKKVSLHDLVFLPTKDTAFAQARVGGPDEIMTFVSPSRIMLQLPMERLSHRPKEWGYGAVGDEGYWWTEARLLVPDPDCGGHYKELAVNWGDARSSQATLQLKDLPKINLSLVRAETPGAPDGGNLFGYQMSEIKRAARSLADVQTEIKAAADYYKVNAPGDQAFIPWPAEGRIEGINLSNGEILELAFLKLDLQIRLEGMMTENDGGVRRVLVMSTNGFYEMFPSPDYERLYCLKDSEGGIYDLAVDETGVHVFKQRDHIREFLFPPSSVGFEMVGIDGGGYTSSKKSVATRKHRSQPHDEIQKYELTAVLGRWDGAPGTAFAADADTDTDLARLRLVVSVDAQGQLSVSPGVLKPEERSHSGSWLWGEDFNVRIVEDEWMGPHGLVRGKVRLVFSKSDAVDAAGKTCSPYGTLEFDSRENLVGAFSRFKMARAHHHKAAHLSDRKLFPQDRGFLTRRAGVAVSEMQVNEIDFTGGEGTLLLARLAATEARASDIPVLVEALTFLQLHNATLKLFDGSGRPDEKALVAMAAFGMSRNPEVQTGDMAAAPRRRTSKGGTPVAQAVPQVAQEPHASPKIKALGALAPALKTQLHPALVRVNTLMANPSGMKMFAGGIWSSRNFIK